MPRPLPRSPALRASYIVSGLLLWALVVASLVLQRSADAPRRKPHRLFVATDCSSGRFSPP